jgi:hypothetical protein
MSLPDGADLTAAAGKGGGSEGLVTWRGGVFTELCGAGLKVGVGQEGVW